jgi:hypothetical protein
MKKLLLALVSMSCLSTAFASELADRAVALNDLCNKNLKVNAGIYKLNQGCKVELAEEKAPEIEGICRGVIKDKSQQKISYKIVFSTKAQEEKLNFIAVTEGSLWNLAENVAAEVKAYQPTWKEFRNQRYVIVNRNTSSSLMMGHQSVVHITSPDIDMVMLYGRMGLSQMDPYQASIKVKTYRGEFELKNATCDILSVRD